MAPHVDAAAEVWKEADASQDTARPLGIYCKTLPAFPLLTTKPIPEVMGQHGPPGDMLG